MPRFLDDAPRPLIAQLDAALFLTEFEWQALRAKAAEAEQRASVRDVRVSDLSLYVNELVREHVRDDAAELARRARLATPARISRKAVRA